MKTIAAIGLSPGILCVIVALGPPAAAPPVEVSGIYPHLAYSSDAGECGTGAVVPWADRLWAVTYSPHQPLGSADKLYEIDARLNVTIRPESVGGTPANRMIHCESRQLLIGPYVIDARGEVRAIPPRIMPGRLTGNARHLTDPAGKVYYATMEEGLYEVDVVTLEVTELFADDQGQIGAGEAAPAAAPLADLPGYHGKGLYSGQGRLIYANNGEPSDEARLRPDIPSGCLAEWDGTAWRVVRRAQFTEVTGPGGILGNAQPARDPVWSIGWDHRSLILMLLDGGEWSAYRLPKASHAYDGAHGWNTEWPRIRDIGGRDLLMTMHGMFWRFPRTFGRGRSAGIRPRSTYLKVIGDFCRWGDRLVLGCDDAAKSEFLNTRRGKGNIAGPAKSQSNLWFVDPGRLDRLGVPFGRGAVWLDDAVPAGVPSEPFLFSGFDRRAVHLAHETDAPVTFTFEMDRRGNDRWTELRRVEVPAGGYRWVSFPAAEHGAWVRIRADRDCERATVLFTCSDCDRRRSRADARFAGLARPGDAHISGGLLRNGGANLQFAARTADAFGVANAGYYELDAELSLRRVEDPEAEQWLRLNVAIPHGVVSADAASVVYVDEAGARWRLPKGDPAFDRPGPLGAERVDREVVTERDLFNCHGTFYELPAENAGGFARIRPIATHNCRIHDYCSFRGMLVLSGVAAETPAANPHIVRSDDGRVALWLGVVDDLWELGKPRGRGGPWRDTAVRAGEPSDPYLMTGYDRKRVGLAHAAPEPVTLTIEVDIAGTGLWRVWEAVVVAPGRRVERRFPAGFEAYWVRVIADCDCRATVVFEYE